MASRFSLSGLEAIKQQFRRVSNDVKRKALLKAARAGNNPILSTARELVPVRTGELRDSLHAGTRKRGELVAEGQVRNTKETYYGRFIEFGFNHVSGKSVPAVPFMRAAFDMNIGRAFRMAGDAFAAVLFKVGVGKVDEAVSAAAGEGGAEV